MKQDLIEDIERIKKIHNECKREYSITNIFYKCTGAKIVMIGFLILIAFYIIFLFCKTNFCIFSIPTVLCIIIGISFGVFYCNIMDNYIKKILCLDEKKKYNACDLLYCLFIDRFKKNMPISTDRIKIIIDKLELENDSKTDIVNNTFRIIGVLISIYSNEIQKILEIKPFFIFVFISIGIFFFIVPDVFQEFINRKMNKNNYIIQKLKKYVLETEYKKVQ